MKKYLLGFMYGVFMGTLLFLSIFFNTSILLGVFMLACAISLLYYVAWNVNK